MVIFYFWQGISFCYLYGVRKGFKLYIYIYIYIYIYTHTHTHLVNLKIVKSDLWQTAKLQRSPIQSPLLIQLQLFSQKWHLASTAAAALKGDWISHLPEAPGWCFPRVTNSARTLPAAAAGTSSWIPETAAQSGTAKLNSASPTQTAIPTILSMISWILIFLPFLSEVAIVVSVRLLL